jgi:hypothetical protein
VSRTGSAAWPWAWCRGLGTSGAFAGSRLIAGVVEHASHGGGFLTAVVLLIAALGGFVLVEGRLARNSYRDRQRAVSAPRAGGMKPDGVARVSRGSTPSHPVAWNVHVG